MPAKMARSAPRPPFGLPEVMVAVRIALLPCREPGKPRISKPVPGSSGESRFTSILFVVFVPVCSNAAMIFSRLVSAG